MKIKQVKLRVKLYPDNQPADEVVTRFFRDIQAARLVHRWASATGKPAKARNAQLFERQAWDYLMQYFLRDDDGDETLT